MRDDPNVGNAPALAKFIRSLYAKGCISRAQARKALDRLALRMEDLGEVSLAEEVSAIYMRC